MLHTFYQPFPAPKSTSLASLRTPRNTATRVTIYWQQPLSSFDPMPQVLSQRPALVKDSQPVDTTLSSTQSSPPLSSKFRQSPFAAHSPNCFDTPTKQRPQSVLSTQHATCNAISFNATHCTATNVIGLVPFDQTPARTARHSSPGKTPKAYSYLTAHSATGNKQCSTHHHANRRRLQSTSNLCFSTIFQRFEPL